MQKFKHKCFMLKHAELFSLDALFDTNAAFPPLPGLNLRH